VNTVINKNKISVLKGAGKKDCILLFKPNDDVELHVPEMKPTDAVPPYMELATIIMILMTTQDKEFYKLIGKKQKEIQQHYKKLLS
jgi:hypothetical protein